MEQIDLKHIRALLFQPIKYLFTGGAAFAADFAIYWIVSSFAHFQVATFLGLFTGLGINFILSKFWVFENNKKYLSKKELLLFSAFTALGFLLTSLGMYIGVDILYLNDKVLRIAIAVIIFIMNYFVRKYIIFSKSN